MENNIKFDINQEGYYSNAMFFKNLIRLNLIDMPEKEVNNFDLKDHKYEGEAIFNTKGRICDLWLRGEAYSVKDDSRAEGSVNFYFYFRPYYTEIRVETTPIFAHFLYSYIKRDWTEISIDGYCPIYVDTEPLNKEGIFLHSKGDLYPVLEYEMKWRLLNSKESYSDNDSRHYTEWGAGIPPLNVAENALVSLILSQTTKNNLYNFVYDCMWDRHSGKGRKPAKPSMHSLQYNSFYFRPIEEHMFTPELLKKQAKRDKINHYDYICNKISNETGVKIVREKTEEELIEEQSNPRRLYALCIINRALKDAYYSKDIDGLKEEVLEKIGFYDALKHSLIEAILEKHFLVEELYNKLTLKDIELNILDAINDNRIGRLTINNFLTEYVKELTKQISLQNKVENKDNIKERIINYYKGGNE
jgi:hypothetical protein